MNISPVVHATKLPALIDLSRVNTSWFYYYKDELSPEKGELLVPTLGHAFGGSTEDARYSDKEYKPEDCSSSVGKWLGSQFRFTTLDMSHVFYGTCGDDEVCKKLSQLIFPVSKSLLEVEAGDIFVFRTSTGGHTGIIESVNIDKQCFNSVSYSRNMPGIEGLGFMEFCPSSNLGICFYVTLLVLRVL